MPLFVFLHGVGETPQAWQDQVVGLPPGVKAVAPWLRGTRPGRDEAFSITGAADDVLALLNQHGVEQMTLIGSSIGAVVALDAAVRAPETVSHLVLAAGQVKPPPGLARMQRLAFGLMPARKLANMGISKKQFLAALDETTGFDYSRRLGEVTARTLVVVGDRDKPNRPAADQLAAGIPDAHLAVIPDAGATAHTDNPRAFNDAVFGFLASA